MPGKGIRFRRLIVVGTCAAVMTSLLPMPGASAATFGPGSGGGSVTQLQRDLAAKGFYRGAIDGIYDEPVSQAVMAFRKEVGASRSFSWNTSLNATLRNYVKPWTPLRIGEPDRVEVNLTRQVLYLFKAGELRAVIPISSGNGELYRGEHGTLVRAFTPVGNFKVTRHIVGWRTSFLGQLYNPWYFVGGYAIHGSMSVPAHPASHGCVRVTMWDSTWLERQLYIGMPVHVWREPAGVGPKIGTTFEPDRSSVAPIPGRYVGDFDGDRLDDGASYAHSSGTWWVAPHRTSAKIWATFSTLSGWGERLVGDFNGDGRDDIANLHVDTMSWSVSRSSGSSFSTNRWTEFATKHGWAKHLVGDFNGDGRDDLAHYHPATGNWVVSLSNGSSFTNKTWTNFATKDGWVKHLVGDFNRDGRDDLAHYHSETGNWIVSLSNGWSFSSSTWTTLTTTSGWDIEFVADLNDDRRQDIAIRHETGVWWALMSTGDKFLNKKWVNSPPK